VVERIAPFLDVRPRAPFTPFAPDAAADEGEEH
jgi:hypothetical protein